MDPRWFTTVTVVMLLGMEGVGACSGWGSYYDVDKNGNVLWIPDVIVEVRASKADGSPLLGKASVGKGSRGVINIPFLGEGDDSIKLWGTIRSPSYYCCCGILIMPHSRFSLSSPCNSDYDVLLFTGKAAEYGPCPPDPKLKPPFLDVMMTHNGEQYLEKCQEVEWCFRLLYCELCFLSLCG